MPEWHSSPSPDSVTTLISLQAICPAGTTTSSRASGPARRASILTCPVPLGRRTMRKALLPWMPESSTKRSPAAGSAALTYAAASPGGATRVRTVKVVRYWQLVWGGLRKRSCPGLAFRRCQSVATIRRAREATTYFASGGLNGTPVLAGSVTVHGT